jgi:hypothetical protein
MGYASRHSLPYIAGSSAGGFRSGVETHDQRDQTRHFVAPIAIAQSRLTATGPIPVVTVTSGGVTVSLPEGWKTTSDASRGVFIGQQDPSREGSAVMMVMVQPTGVTAIEDQLLDAGRAARAGRDRRQGY